MWKNFKYIQILVHSYSQVFQKLIWNCSVSVLKVIQLKIFGIKVSISL